MTRPRRCSGEDCARLPCASASAPHRAAGRACTWATHIFAQGNGEVALEAPLRVTVTVDVIPRAKAAERYVPVLGPFARTREFLVPTGMAPDLAYA